MIEFVQQYWQEKMQKNINYMICTYFDLRVRKNLSEEDIKQFLELSKNMLENNYYNVYFKGESYFYRASKLIVKDNELMVAVKNHI